MCLLPVCHTQRLVDSETLHYEDICYMNDLVVSRHDGNVNVQLYVLCAVAILFNDCCIGGVEKLAALYGGYWIVSG